MIDLMTREGDPGQRTPFSTAKDLFGIVRDGTLILSVYLYYSGYTYLHNFYQQLGIDANSLDHVLVFGSHSIRKHGLELFVVAEIIVALTLAFRLWRSRSKSPAIQSESFAHIVTAVLVVAGTVAVLDLLGVFAQHDALVSASEYYDTDHGQRTLVLIKEPAATAYPAELTAASGQGQLWLVAESKDWLFLFGPRCGPTTCQTIRALCPHCDLQRSRELFRVAKDDVSAMTINDHP